MRVDTRQRIDREPKGVVTYGSRRIHAIATETSVRRIAQCGRAVERALGSSRAISCDDCKKYLRQMGRAG